LQEIEQFGFLVAVSLNKKFYIKFVQVGQLVHKLNRRHVHMSTQKHVDLISQSQGGSSE